MCFWRAWKYNFPLFVIKVYKSIPFHFPVGSHDIWFIISYIGFEPFLQVKSTFSWKGMKGRWLTASSLVKLNLLISTCNACLIPRYIIIFGVKLYRFCKVCSVIMSPLSSIYFYITIYVCVPHFYDLSALICCWSSVSMRRIIYKCLNVCPFDYTVVAVSGKVERS